MSDFAERLEERMRRADARNARMVAMAFYPLLAVVILGPLFGYWLGTLIAKALS